MATGLGQIWSWDITDLRTPWRGMSFKAYSILDIYSRHDRRLPCRGTRVRRPRRGDVRRRVRSTRIACGRSCRLWAGDAFQLSAKTLLTNLEVDLTHNRPRLSNDNPFSESEFRTMKYRPNYPGTFTISKPRGPTLARLCPWYNQHTPSQRHRALLPLPGPRRPVAGTLAKTPPSPTALLRQKPRTLPHRPHTKAPKPHRHHQPPHQN